MMASELGINFVKRLFFSGFQIIKYSHQPNKPTFFYFAIEDKDVCQKMWTWKHNEELKMDKQHRWRITVEFLNDLSMGQICWEEVENDKTIWFDDVKLAPEEFSECITRLHSALHCTALH